VSQLAVRSKNAHYERWRWQIFAVTWLAYAGYYLTRKSFAVAKIEMGKPSNLALTSEQMGWIDGALLTTYAVFLMPWGIAGDRFGPRVVVLIGMLGSVLTAIAMGFSSLPFMLMALYGLQGAFQASGWGPLSKNMACFFSQRERGTMFGLWSTNYAVGGVIALLIAGYFGDRWGWRYCFIAPACLLFGIWAIFLLFQRNRPEDVGLPPIEIHHGEPEAALKLGEMPNDEHEGSWKVIRDALASPMVWLLGIVYFFMKPTRYAILLWAPKYLNEKLGTDMLQSGALSSLFEVAGVASVLIAGILSDKLFGSRRNPISIICMLLTAVVLLAIESLPANSWMLGGCLFLLGFLLYAPDSLISGTAPIDFGTKKGAATAAGLVTGCGSLGAIAGGTLPGFLHDKWGWDGLFQVLAASLILASCMLLPKWNAKPTVSK
jgi:OPA family sugar phosphate sensor protein UhpC-like MFS transporter